jgi:pimeloyl-ACP methyl ester carboxylesterase
MFIQVGQHTIHFECYGNGPTLLCCLPGYGETGKDFESLARELGQYYTVICPDLPLHGNTSWRQNSFEITDLHQILQVLAAGKGFAGQPMALAGYSMGGRLALAYAQEFPGTLSSLILLAPDGLHQNFWYWLSTQTKAGNYLFRATMQNPRWLFWLMKWSRKLNLLNDSIIKFSHRYLDDPIQRKSLYERWTLFRNLRPYLPGLQKIILSQPLPTLLVFGQFDRIIPPDRSKKITAGNQLNIRVLILEAGHRLLKPQFAATIASAIRSTGKV